MNTAVTKGLFTKKINAEIYALGTPIYDRVNQELKTVRASAEEVKFMLDEMGLDTGDIDFDLIKNSDDLNAAVICLMLSASVRLVQIET